jgi:hypothetical protein
MIRSQFFYIIHRQFRDLTPPRSSTYKLLFGKSSLVQSPWKPCNHQWQNLTTICASDHALNHWPSDTDANVLVPLTQIKAQFPARTVDSSGSSHLLLLAYGLFAAACCGCNPAAAAASTVFFSLWIAAAAVQTAATVSACSQPNTPYSFLISQSACTFCNIL